MEQLPLEYQQTGMLPSEAEIRRGFMMCSLWGKDPNVAVFLLSIAATFADQQMCAGAICMQWDRICQMVAYRTADNEKVYQKLDALFDYAMGTIIPDDEMFRAALKIRQICHEQLQAIREEGDKHFEMDTMHRMLQHLQALAQYIIPAPLRKDK